jgi:putative spermidine/putrescine transport system substrate-binding protein
MRCTAGGRISRRTMVKRLSAALAGTFAAPALLTRVAAQSKTLVVYNFDGILGKFVKESWIDPFAQKHGVRVETLTMQGSSPPMAKIKAQVDAGRPDADVIPMQLTDYVFAVRNNLLMPIGHNEITEYQNLYPQFITDHGPGLILWVYGIAYNTERVKTPPKRWKDLWDPAYKGKVALNEALFEQAVQMVNLAWRGKPTPVDDETFAQLAKLRPNLVSLWTTGAQAEQLMRTGEAWITPLWNGRVYTLKDQGVPIEFVKPEEGFFVRYDPYCIPRGAQNPDLAKQWINFICSEEPQRALAEKLYYASPNKKVTYSPDVAKRVVVSSPTDFKLAVKEDYEGIVDDLGAWRRRWDAWKQS